MRGEDEMALTTILPVDGSPPHARGRLEVGVHRLRDRRITPACAGKTTAGSTTSRRSPDHPRMRGEDPTGCPSTMWFPGSPPHARGRPLPRSGGRVQTRITPACAGKTYRAFQQGNASKDHPRMRGEDVNSGDGVRVIAGSPPHARGRLDGEVKEPKSFRITPACAGKTRPDSGGHCCHWDHPRMRGEDGHVCHTFPHVAGSPPHARGRRHEPPSRARSTGITPACAGKTVKVRPPGLLLLGSPPHARGRRPISGPPCPIVMDHPRMRGEDEFTGIIDKMGKGSPPHARGRHIRV